MCTHVCNYVHHFINFMCTFHFALPSLSSCDFTIDQYLDLISRLTVEHLVKNSTHYFLSGAGSMADAAKMNSSAQKLWVGEKFSAFASVTASKDALTVEFVDSSEAVRYKYTLPRSQNPNKPPTTRYAPFLPQIFGTSRASSYAVDGLFALLLFTAAGVVYTKSLDPISSARGARRKSLLESSKKLTMSSHRYVKQLSPYITRARRYESTLSSPTQIDESGAEEDAENSPCTMHAHPQFFLIGKKQGLVAFPQ